jgi:hypothetical protein
MGISIAPAMRFQVNRPRKKGACEFTSALPLNQLVEYLRDHLLLGKNAD